MDLGNRRVAAVVGAHMRHPHRPTILLILPLLALAACGDGSPVDDAGATVPPVETPAPTVPPTVETAAPTVPPTVPGTAGDDTGSAYPVATGADDVVISVTNEGGFVPAGFAFVNPPIALVSGDGRALSTGPVAAIFPGPLLPNILQRSISPEAVQQLLAEADELGLLADIVYEDPTNIADAGTTIVAITVDGTTYRHAAYALGLEPDGESDPDARRWRRSWTPCRTCRRRWATTSSVPRSPSRASSS